MIREVVVRGATLPEAFREAALALFALTVDPARVRDREIREVRAHGADHESLLAHWIGECCYVREIEGFGCCAIDFAVFEVEPAPGGERMRLHALLRGEVEPDGTTGLEPDTPRCFSLRQREELYEVRFQVEV